MSREFTPLEKDIIKALKAKCPAEVEAVVQFGGIANTVTHFFTIMITGSVAEEVPERDLQRRRQNRKEAYDILYGFLWGMNACNCIENEEKREFTMRLITEWNEANQEDIEKTYRKAVEE